MFERDLFIAGCVILALGLAAMVAKGVMEHGWRRTIKDDVLPLFGPIAAVVGLIIAVVAGIAWALMAFGGLR